MKPWYKSKTIMFNLASTAFGVVAASVQSFAPFMSPAAFGVFAMFVGVVNVGLRFITSQPLTTDKE